jgi:hypothetical protein
MTYAQPSVLVIDDESGILDTLRILLKNSARPDSTRCGRSRRTSCSRTSGCPR